MPYLRGAISWGCQPSEVALATQPRAFAPAVRLDNSHGRRVALEQATRHPASGSATLQFDTGPDLG
jgi:hypothetical protein